ncbi:MAG: nuclear transport factor 2 family protein [Bacteroidales bacterium]|nr:nuclear transport factor 2 family protein [Bacteroidales bacterium]
MKKVIYLLFAVVLFTACNTNQPVRYFSASPEIEVTKSILKAYVDADWDAMKSHYADTAKIQNNVPEKKGISIDAAIEEHKQDHELFSSIRLIDKESFYEMVITDEGETWVNYWGLWKGTLKATGEEFKIPLHITLRFINQKVVREHGYWNNAEIALALYKLEAQSQTP